MRILIKIIILLLSLIIIGEIVAYYLVLNNIAKLAPSPQLLDPSPTIASTPTQEVNQPQIITYKGTVSVFTPDTGQSGRYSYYLEYVQQDGEVWHFRFPKRDMDKITIQYYDKTGNLVKEENTLDLTSILQGDVIDMTVYQQENPSEIDKEFYFSFLFDKIDIKITRDTYEEEPTI